MECSSRLSPLGQCRRVRPDGPCLRSRETGQGSERLCVPSTASASRPVTASVRSDASTFPVTNRSCPRPRSRRSRYNRTLSGEAPRGVARKTAGGEARALHHGLPRFQQGACLDRLSDSVVPRPFVACFDQIVCQDPRTIYQKLDALLARVGVLRVRAGVFTEEIEFAVHVVVIHAVDDIVTAEVRSPSRVTAPTIGAIRTWAMATSTSPVERGRSGNLCIDQVAANI